MAEMRSAKRSSPDGRNNGELKEMESVAVIDQPSTNASGNQDGGPLVVAVTFQKNPHRTQMYLEAEPKALGLTQITLSIFQISMVFGAIMSIGGHEPVVEIILVIGSLFAFIAGSIAIAARNLHLPTLRACLGMQLAACLASALNVVLCSGALFGGAENCWHYIYNSTEATKVCQNFMNGLEHYNSDLLLINIAILAICATLTAYCCKAISCCSPRASMPVITISNPQAQQ